MFNFLLYFLYWPLHLEKKMHENVDECSFSRKPLGRNSLDRMMFSSVQQLLFLITLFMHTVKPRYLKLDGTG